nr:C6 finger domain-containing protein Acr-2 [Colletotrichum truncatum]KAF6786041.1 C6 finger domain-containing protein Acr-2 [Colletotrichum truncatum]
MQNAFFASKSCLTCRQKRVKCDKRLPACLRCSSLKLRCQGYDRPNKLVWTNSIASRGKMMGKTTFNALEQSKNVALSHKPWHPPKQEQSTGAVVEACTSSAAVTWSLMEPSLQDLPFDCRKYIRYFDLDLSRECVVYNQPSTNPFLALMPLMPKSQALSHAMISISAFHYTHRMVISQTQSFSEDGGLVVAERPQRWHISNGRDWQLDQPVFRDSLHTALSHKQKALQFLKQEVQCDPMRNSDAVVAAIVLFICMDVVEFGSHGWNHHLRGAEEMVRSRRMLSNNDAKDYAPWLKYFDAACITFGILGATLAPTLTRSAHRYPVLDSAFLESLRHSENQTWVGCPAELLYLLSAINSMRLQSPMDPEQLETTTKICKTLFEFSPLAWAEDFPAQEHHESRYHLAHAYKAAVEVYASHVIGALPGQHYLSGSFVLETIQLAILHMLKIAPTDFHIKSLVWPAFVLGAEAQNPELREMVRTIFQRIWVSSCCYNARNAVEILESIWARDLGERIGKSWLEYVWQFEETWLFV